MSHRFRISPSFTSFQTPSVMEDPYYFQLTALTFLFFHLYFPYFIFHLSANFSKPGNMGTKLRVLFRLFFYCLYLFTNISCYGVKQKMFYLELVQSLFYSISVCIECNKYICHINLRTIIIKHINKCLKLIIDTFLFLQKHSLLN